MWLYAVMWVRHNNMSGYWIAEFLWKIVNFTSTTLFICLYPGTVRRGLQEGVSDSDMFWQISEIITACIWMPIQLSDSVVFNMSADWLSGPYRASLLESKLVIKFGVNSSSIPKSSRSKHQRGLSALSGGYQTKAKHGNVILLYLDFKLKNSTNRAMIPYGYSLKLPNSPVFF